MKYIFLFISLFLSNYVFSQEFEIVQENSGWLVKPNDEYLINKDRLYHMKGNSVTVWDADLNMIGTIYNNSYNSKIYFANALPGLMFSYSYSQLDYNPYLEITQTLFNDDEYYEALRLTEDTVFIYRLESEVENESGTVVRAEFQVLQTILPPEGFKFYTNNDPYIISTKAGNYIGIQIRDKGLVYYKINKKDATAVRSGVMISSEASEVKYYDISGKQIDKPVKGINIVKYDDGSVKKQLYK